MTLETNFILALRLVGGILLIVNLKKFEIEKRDVKFQFYMGYNRVEDSLMKILGVCVYIYII